MNLRPFESVAGLPVVCGNSARILIDGKETFEALFEVIDAAECYLLVQFYIYRDDDLGREVAARLMAAARRGVKVWLAYDVFRPVSLRPRLLREMADAGIRIAHARSGGPIVRRFQFNFRNHRKALIADGRVGFLGGHNVGDEYMGRSPHLRAVARHLPAGRRPHGHANCSSSSPRTGTGSPARHCATRWNGHRYRRRAIWTG